MSGFRDERRVGMIKGSFRLLQFQDMIRRDSWLGVRRG